MWINHGRVAKGYAAGGNGIGAGIAPGLPCTTKGEVGRIRAAGKGGVWRQSARVHRCIGARKDLAGVGHVLVNGCDNQWREHAAQQRVADAVIHDPGVIEVKATPIRLLFGLICREPSRTRAKKPRICGARHLRRCVCVPISGKQRASAKLAYESADIGVTANRAGRIAGLDDAVRKTHQPTDIGRTSDVAAGVGITDGAAVVHTHQTADTAIRPATGLHAGRGADCGRGVTAADEAGRGVPAN